MVEVAGIEPASERLQRIEPTCVSNPFEFRECNVRIGRSAHPLAPLVFVQDPRARIPAYPAVWRLGPPPQAWAARRDRL